MSYWKLRNADSLLDCFRIPKSRHAYNEFLALQEEFALLQPMVEDSKDNWTYIWGHHSYTSNRFY